MTTPALQAYRTRWSKPKETEMPGTTRCLMCRETFDSEHCIRIRVCKDCKRTELWQSSRSALA